MERNRVTETLQSEEALVEIQEPVEEYKKSFKPEPKNWKMHFVTFEAFLKVGCGVEIKGTHVYCEQFRYWCFKFCISSVFDGSLPYSPTISPPHYYYCYYYPPSLDSAMKEEKVFYIVCGGLKSTARSRKISTPAK